MSPQTPLGQMLHSLFADHLITIKGLRPASVRSYRDTIRLLIVFIAADKRSKITKLTVGDLTFDRIVAFLRHLEEDRHNHIRTRNQRLAVIHTLFEYIATRSPEMLIVCQRVAAIPSKRVAPPETRFLERDEMQQLLADLPRGGRLALRDRALILFLYNTGARVQEAADLRVEHLDLGQHPTVRLHGKGDKWRTCPLWQETARTLQQLLESENATTPQHAVFTHTVNRSPVTGSTRSSAVTAPVLMTREPAGRSARTSSGTPPQSICSRPASRSTSSADGSATQTSAPPIATPRSQKPRGRPAENRTPGSFEGIPHQPNLEDR